MTAVVLVVSADYVARTGLRVLLETEGRFSRVAEANGVAAATVIATRDRPSVTVIDAETVPLDRLGTLTRATPPVRVVVLSPHDSEATLRQALKAGALGFVVRTGEYTKVLIEIVDRVRRGQAAVCPIGLAHLIQAYTEQIHHAASMFTPPETEVLALVVDGHTNEAMAGRLHVSVGTIKSHVANILRKLDVPNRAAAIARLVRVSGPNGISQDSIRRIGAA